MADPALNASLVIAPQWIGDAVMTEPLMRRLAARGERLTVAALPWVAPVYRAMPQVADVIELPFAHGRLDFWARRALGKSLKGKFDTAYVCPNSFKSALIPWWAGIHWRVGYLGENRRFLLNVVRPQAWDSERTPMVAFYSALSGDARVDADRPSLYIPRHRILQALESLALEPQGYYVMAPGAEYGPAKRWPAEHFAALGRNLALPVVLLGSAKDADVCATIATAINAARPGHCIDLSGRTPLDQALALVASAKAMVSNDSGLMHVAAAFEVPQVAVFGSSSPLHTPPLSDKATVVWLKNDPAYQPALTCAPCFERDCPLGHTRCLVDIQPAKVLAYL